MKQQITEPIDDRTTCNFKTYINSGSFCVPLLPYLRVLKVPRLGTIDVIENQYCIEVHSSDFFLRQFEHESIFP